MEIRLHIGAHRTGSTRVQAELARRAAHLATRGVAVVRPEDLRGEPSGLGPIQMRLPGPLRAAIAAKAYLSLVEARRAAEEQGARCLLISEENLAGSMEANLRSGRLYADIRLRLSGLRPLLGTGPVTVLMAIRSYDELFASAYAFRAVRGPRPDFSQSKPRILALSRRWPSVAKDVLRALPQAQLRVWDYDASRRSEHEMMREVIGLRDIVPVNAALPVLPAPSAKAVEVLNTMTAPEQMDLAQRRAVAERYPRPDFAAFDPWTAEERAHLRDAYAEDLETLRSPWSPRLSFAELTEPCDA